VVLGGGAFSYERGTPVLRRGGVTRTIIVHHGPVPDAFRQFLASSLRPPALSAPPHPLLMAAPSLELGLCYQ